MEDKERLNKEADHSTLVGGRFQKLGYLRMRLVLGSHETSKSPHPPTRILRDLKWVQPSVSPDGLNNTSLSQSYVLETTPSFGMVGGTHIPRRGGSKKSNC